jgi:threonine dehydrogenase-like Zn-dependent dehydrogenase
VADLGATYHHTSVEAVAKEARPDIVIEATGSGQVVLDAISETGSYGIVCLTGVSPRGRMLKVDAGALNREVVLENDAVVGSVNANLRHFRAAATALAAADPQWLQQLITTVVPLDEAQTAFDRPPGKDVKVVISLEESPAGT